MPSQTLPTDAGRPEPRTERTPIPPATCPVEEPDCGGSSAGATIQGSFLVRGSVKNNTIMVAQRPSHREGFGLLRDSAIDQHLLVRHRENDLVPVIAARPKLLGIGLDQSTAIVVHAGEFTVIGASKVAIYDNKDHAGKKYYFLSHGEKFNLATRTAEQ